MICFCIGRQCIKIYCCYIKFFHEQSIKYFKYFHNDINFSLLRLYLLICCKDSSSYGDFYCGLKSGDRVDSYLYFKLNNILADHIFCVLCLFHLNINWFTV